MKAAALSEIKNELVKLSPKKVIEICLRLARFKKENKELIAFLLFDEDDEPSYVESIKIELNDLFEDINTTNWYFMKKGFRKILRTISKYSRYMNLKESEVELQLHFLHKVQSMGITKRSNKTLVKLYENQIQKTNKLIKLLHEDLQYDYTNQLNILYLN